MCPRRRRTCLRDMSVAMPERLVTFRGAGDIAAMASARVADKRDRNDYLWSFYDLRTGKALGEVPSIQNYAPFAVLGPGPLHEVQPYEGTRTVSTRRCRCRWRRSI